MSPWAWGAILLFVVASAWAHVQLADDCEQKGGVLVKDYAGNPACVAGPGH